MTSDKRKPRSPGTDVAIRGPDRTGSGVTSALWMATDVAIGAASQATRLAVRVGGTGWEVGVSAGRIVSALPGAHLAGGLLRSATRPLADGGREVRSQAWSSAQARTQRIIEANVPRIIDALDVDQLVQQIDVNAVVQRIDIDALVKRIEIDEVVQRIDIDQLVGRIDIDALVGRIDIDALVGRIEIDALVQRIDIDTLVRRIEIDDLVQRIDIDALGSGSRSTR